MYNKRMILTLHVPEYVKILVKAGQIVDFNAPFYEITTDSDYEISVAKKLNVSPNKIFHYLKKLVGEDVKKGDTLALKKSFFSSQKIICENDGKIKEINHDIGNIIITAKIGESNTVKTFFKGEITEIKNRDVHIKIKSGESFPLKKLSGNFGGEVFYLKENENNSVVSADLSKKCLACSSISSYLESKVEALGITGYITLHVLPEESTLNFAQLKEIDDVKTIMKRIYPYCITDTKSSTITFYG